MTGLGSSVWRRRASENSVQKNRADSAKLCGVESVGVDWSSAPGVEQRSEGGTGGG